MSGLLTSYYKMGRAALADCPISSQINQNYRLMKIGKYLKDYKNHAKVARPVKKSVLNFPAPKVNNVNNIVK
jgi:hypothetical protein